jgi:hypothetical protein
MRGGFPTLISRMVIVQGLKEITRISLAHGDWYWDN